MIRRILRNPSLAVDVLAVAFALSCALILWLASRGSAL